MKKVLLKSKIMIINDNGYTRKEQKIYDSVNGGEKGKQAVIAYRDYIRDYTEMERQFAKENTCNRFYCRNEKTTATLPIAEDDYTD